MSKNRSGMQSLDQRISQLLQPIFSGNKKEFIIISNLIKNWEEVIGKKYAKFCYPKSINFAKDKSGAKLTIAVYNSSVGFFLENNSEFLIEKIAGLYGYKAVSRIIIKQEPKEVESAKAEIKLPAEQQRKLDNALKDVVDPELAAALDSLGKEIFFKK